MSKVDDIDSLLPGFRQFLVDLSFVSLPSDLSNKVQQYLQIIEDYLDQNLSAPSDAAPVPPSVTSIPNTVIDVEALRKESWRNSKVPQNNYQNFDQNNEDFYETPVQEIKPELPARDNRPPLKRVITDEDVYEEPGDGTESGRGSMPPGSDEGSAGSFVFRKSSDFSLDYDSEASTDYEDMDDDIVQDKAVTSDKPKKPKINKLDEFKAAHEGTEYDLIGVLFSYGNVMGTVRANIMNKWTKRYCIARDGQLVIYKSYKDKKGQKMPLLGYEVYFVGLQSGRENVFRVNHSGTKPLLLATNSKTESDKWVEVLNGYATMDHTIIPTTSGYTGIEPSEETEEPVKKGGGFLNFGKKEKDGTQQITIDEHDNLAGYANIFGARYGEAKVKRKWITIQDNTFTCAPSRDESVTFSFQLSDIRVDNADKKEAKMKNAYKVSQDSEVLLYVEAVNKVDAGTLLKKLVEIMTKNHEKSAPAAPSPGKEETTTKATEGIVARLMATFESTPTSPGDQPDFSGQHMRRKKSVEEQIPHYDDTIVPGPTTTQEELYDDVELEHAKTSPVKSLYQRKIATLPAKLKGPKKDGEKDTSPLALDTSSIGEKKETEKERKAREKKEKKEREKEEREREKKEKKEKEEKEKKEKEEKKKKEKEERRKEKEAAAAAAAAEEAAKEAEEAAAEEAEDKPAVKIITLEPSPKLESKAKEEKKETVQEEKKEHVHQPIQRRTTDAALRLGDQSGTSHLMLKDKLMLDRKDLENKQSEAAKKKSELRDQMKNTADPDEKAKFKQQLDAAQKEWSNLNKQIAEMSRQIEDATHGKDVNDNKPKLKPTPRPVSPDREKVSKGTVSERMKVFGGN